MFVYVIYTHVYIIWCNHIPYCLICLKPVRSLDLYRNHCWLFLATWLRLACLEFRHFAKHLSNAKSTRRIWLWLPRVWGEMSHDGEIAKKNLEKKMNIKLLHHFPLDSYLTSPKKIECWKCWNPRNSVAQEESPQAVSLVVAPWPQ